MSDYPLWAYRQQLEQQYSKTLNNPLSDQGTVFDIKKAIDEKVQEFAYKQQQAHRRNIEEYKKEMP